jgi:hypothetical protein
MARRLKLGQLLISKGLLEPEQLASALAEQERWGSRLGMTLVRLGYIQEDLLVKVLSRQLELPVARITGKRVKREILDRVPAELAEKYRCIPLFVREEAGGEVLFVGMDDPSDLASIDELSLRIEQSVKPVLVSPTELEEALQRNYHGSEGAAASAPAPQPAAAAPQSASLSPASGPGFPSEPEPAPGASADTQPTLPPMQMSAPVSEPGPPRPDDADTEPQLPPMDSMLAAPPDTPDLDGLEDDPVLDGLSDAPDLKDLDEDPVLGGFANDPVLGNDELDDPAAMSFSAAGEEPLAGLAEAPFSETDPDMGGFVGGPFGTSEDEAFGDLGASPFGEDVADASESASQSSASSAALEAGVIMQALAQLLVEKGVIGRDEFAERIRRLAAKNPKSA